jgi:hypothetical protein
VNEHRSVGRYEILREIGHGGTATVYLARQTDLGRLVALKELSAIGVADATTARRFVRESRLAGSLNHPNIVTVHDFFEDRATPYIAMEYLERGSLRPVMRRLTFAQIAGVVEGLLAGLRHAHECGVVHRDVKPENLMISDASRVKIADFGIAKATDETGTLLTSTGTTIGTPAYMAPEQAMGQEIGPWTDLYAVGMIAFELLAGRTPFDSTGTPMAVLLRHVNEQPLELVAVDPSADPRISDWIGGLVATDVADRTASAGAAWLAFEEIVIDRLGSRWRREAPLDAAPHAATPPTILLEDADVVGEVGMPTAMPRLPAANTPVAPARARRPRGAIAGVGGAVVARRLARSVVLIMALAVAVAAALAIMPGGSSKPEGAPTASPAAQGAPAARKAPPPRAGVGDSQSDDPSDDEPDSGEP